MGAGEFNTESLKYHNTPEEILRAKINAISLLANADKFILLVAKDMLLLLAVEEKHIPRKKREAYRILFPSVSKAIYALI